MAGNGSIHLTWVVNTTQSGSVTWQIAYIGGPGAQVSPITGITRDTRTFNLTGLTNYQAYTVTLTAIDGATPILSEKVVVIPTDHLFYMPFIR